MTTRDRDLVMGVTPFGRPDPAVVVGLVRAGALGVLDLGAEPHRARRALTEVARWVDEPFGVRVGPGCPLGPDDLPAQVDTVVLHDPTLAAATDGWGGRRVLIEVRSPAEATAAATAGADGLVAKGEESGGRIGELAAFVLLQELVGLVDLPVWSQGGIGLHTAAAAVAGGAAGVVLDAQLALVRDSTLDDDVRAAVEAMDGSETVVIAGHRVFTRPDLPVASLADDLPAAEVAAALGADDLRAQLLPVGQDGAFASWLAERFGTAGGVAQAVRAAVADDREAAVRARPLAPGSALAADHGLRYPVAQGPMTRVSDRAPFAAGVAEAGALPFLALALMPGDEVRSLLTETAERLGDRTWGVGILGFVPPEVRDAQLEVVLDVRPPVALIAGGRPSQAAPLEEAGIATYLHVPSPGLLDRFLRDGARRFVLEGRECGGHVGPRSSFTLWETQLEVIRASGVDPAEISLLFAGGIHDERSAAMVATLAGPLAEAGAKVGVLMGTAYLFTEEAVAGGAILPGFQDEAVHCAHTVLLETSPGHATRCAETDYVRAFRAEKERLQAAGVGKDEMWAELEQLNLGRLRIASKGLRRTEAGIGDVDEVDQHRDGMYMIGDVARLQHRVVPAVDLHERVTSGATDLLGDRPTVVTGGDERRPEPLDVAIVGMAGFFPGAGDVDRFWANVVGGVDSVTEVPAERWSAEAYYDPEAFLVDAGKKTPSKWGGFLPDVPFDALAYGIPPSSLAAIEPAQLLSLEAAARALADAGYPPERELDRSRVSVVFGAEGGTDLATAYGFRSLWHTYVGELPDGLDEYLPEFTEDSFPGLLTNVIAGRIANRLDLGGSNYTVDAACAASLAALNLGCQDLAAGSSDVVLVGGADLHNGINDYLLFSSVHALSPTGRCRTFDADADGITLGEGVACVVLKRLADAERDGDRVYAVVRGIAGSSDGRHLGLTAPRKEGQQLALRRAYAQADVSPAAVGLVEAHGTGTVVGDRTELATLTEVFAEAGAEPGTATVGSVKSMVGHTKCAAGLAGLIKVAKALHHGVRPTTLHVDTPTPSYDPDHNPFRFEAGARPWAAGERAAGLSAFGFGGTNFHAVLTSYDGAPEPESGLEEWPAELFLFRGADLDEARRQVEALAALADPPEGKVPPRLRDLAATAARAGSGPVQLAVVATDLDDLRARLAEVAAGEVDGKATFAADQDADPAAEAGKVAFLFPGQGSQRPGMLADLFVAFPRLRRLLRAGERWTPALFPPAPFGPDDRAAQQEAITDTRVAQPTLGIAGLAMFDVLRSAGVVPDLLAGHSYGELVALSAAGAIAEDDLLDLSEARAEAILGAAGEDPGAMAAVSGGADAVREALGDGSPVVVANDNSPKQAVISGPTAEVEAAVVRLGEAGLRAKRIPVACAFHSPVVAGAVDAFAERLGEVELGSPRAPVFSNTTTEPYPADADGLRHTLAGQLGAGVRFREQLLAMHEAGARTFVEVGPGRVLTQLVGKNLGDRPHLAVATDVAGEPGIPRLLAALAQLAVHGLPVDASALLAGRGARAVRADRLADRPRWLVNGHLVRTVDGQVVAGSLRPADEVPEVVVGTGPTGAGGPAGGRDDAVVEYLRGTRELIAAQRDVLLSYLGGPVPAAPGLTPVEPVGATAPAAIDVAEAGAAAGADEAMAPAAGGAVLSPDELLAAVLGIVSDRTGYPLDMLDPDLDLEADLSIDSIKRIEIVGELADRVGLPGADEGALDESVVEELAQLKTLRGIVDWIVAMGEADGADAAGEADDASAAAERPAADEGSEPAGTVPDDAAVPAPASAEGGADAPSVPDGLRRYVPVVVELDPPTTTPTTLAGRRVAVVDDGRGVALELTTLIEDAGAEVRVLRNGGPAGEVDVLVDLVPLAGGALELTHRFTRLQEAVLGGATSILVATGLGGDLGLEPDGNLPDDPLAGTGLRGMVRSLVRERADVRARLVDLDPKADAAGLARLVFDELVADDDHVEVGRQGERRCAARIQESPLVGEGAPPLDRDSVVLLTGGARGITARAALALAGATGCRIELVGRSPLPEADPADLAGADDAPALRKALIARGLTDPAAVEAELSRVVAAREVRATLAALDELGCPATYHQADVRDADAVAAVVADVRARHGRLDGIVHGAGVLEDRFLADKDPASFDRVVGTKVDGARSLVDALGDDVRFLVLFASISGVFGNRGQIDYAAANSALDALAHRLAAAGRRAGGATRVVAVDWGPWAGGGMVSPELEREYERRGVGLVDPGEGVSALLRELAPGVDDPQVVLMRALPDAWD